MAHRKLLFIAYYMPPMGSSGVQRPFNLLSKLPEMGWDPTVLCPETGAYHTFDYSLGKRFDQLELPVVRVRSNTPFHLLGGKARKINPSSEKVSKVLRWISAFFFLPDNKKAWINPAIIEGRKLIRRNKFDLIVATSPPPSNLIIASKLASEFNIPLVVDMRDDWLDNHQQIYPSSYHRSLMARIERSILPMADAIVSVNEVIQQAIQSRYPQSKASFYTIPSGFDPLVFTNNISPSVIKENGKITFLYSGRFYGENQPFVFLKAVSRLLVERPELRSRIHLAFQGGLDDEHLAMIQKLELTEFSQNLGYLDHKDAVANLLHADVLWLTAGHTYKGDQVSTGKVTEYMGSGKPILALAPKNGALDALLSGYGPSFLADPHSIEPVTLALKSLLNDIMGGTLPSVNEEYVKRFTSEAMASSFVRVLNNTALPKHI